MKSMNCLAFKVVVVLLCVSLWFLYQGHTENQRLQAENEQLVLALAEAKQTLESLVAENEVLERKSVEGLLRETNKVVVSGWETLLNTVEQELNKAREMIQQKKQSSEGETVKPKNKEEDAPVIIQGERT